MVPVVHYNRQDGPEPVKGHATNSQVLHPPGKISRKKEHGPHIVVDHPYIQTLPDLPHKNFKHPVPHYTLLNYKVLKEYVTLCLLHFLEHGIKHFLTKGVVFCHGIPIERVVALRVHIPGCTRGPLVNRFKTFSGFTVLNQQWKYLFVLICKPCAHKSGGPLVSKDQIEQSPKNRQGHNKDYPADFVGGILLLHVQEQDHQNTENRKG